LPNLVSLRPLFLPSLFAFVIIGRADGVEFGLNTYSTEHTSKEDLSGIPPIHEVSDSPAASEYSPHRVAPRPTALAQASPGARWQELGNTGQASLDRVYVDLDSIHQDGDYRVASFMTVYEKPRVNPNNVLLDRHVQITAFDCRQRTFALVSTVGYFAGKQVGESPRDSEWRKNLKPVPQDAFSQRAYSLLCAVSTDATGSRSRSDVPKQSTSSNEPPRAPNDQDKPTIITEQRGKITNYRVEGSLAPTQDVACIDLADAKSTYTPPDLHTGVAKCVQEGEFDKAGRLFALSGIYASFDAERVADPSVRGGGQILMMSTSAKFSTEQKEKLSAAVQKISKEPSDLKGLCSQIARIGPPTYFPKYLILHGLNAFTSANPTANALKPDFDSAATWTHLQRSYLNCPL